ncbi:hypothetical protein EV702DRAFT_1111104 [Suillus placidus]|uniref:Secreted protein n=1 Tax=Suillus placidus TaxID=48579 RepID=A0A9P6ZTZ8_9AGAM|nr:hypothetical protein EV702DRAFT_1111104 [Suillus placidus]
MFWWWWSRISTWSRRCRGRPLGVRLALLLCFLWRRRSSKYDLSVLDCSNVDDTRTTKEDGPPWTLLQFGWVIGIAMRTAESRRKATEEHTRTPQRGCERAGTGGRGTVIVTVRSEGISTICHVVEKVWQKIIILGLRSIRVH